MKKLIATFDETERYWDVAVPEVLIGNDNDASVHVIAYPDEDIVDAIHRAGYEDCTFDDIEFRGSK